MKNVLKSVAALIAVCALGTSAYAQDEGGPQTWGDDAVYITVTFVDFKSGMRTRAFEIIANHFMPAGEAAGTPAPRVVHFQTGAWDASFHWELEGGLADLEWFISPNNVKFMESLAEREGGMEAAQALMSEYQGTIAKSITSLGHYHDPEAGDD